MSNNTLAMYMIAAVFATIGVVVLVRLRAPLSEPAAYAHRIAGVMTCVFALMLASFATVSWRAGW